MRELLPRLKRLDQLIQLELTGRPTELAGKIGISERSIYDYLKLMRQMGAPIKFSHERRSYYYEPAGRFLIGFNIDN
jgi:predicted DNA-binding transcriptional regulator YafY